MEDNANKSEGLGSTVASHYNNLKEIGIEARKESRIFYMRGLNNWIKSILINEFIEKLKNKFPNKPLTVLDLGSGKGGDQKKWKQARVSKVIHADIAETSVRQSEERYKQIKEHENPRYPLFEAEFITADCTKERLVDRYKDRDVEIDMTSCQFVYHYSFESLEQADMMLRNACERLRPGGFFIGTTPDCRELVKRLNMSDGLSFGNDVYRVTFESKTDFPLFGCKYNFHLEEVVDCPEFLVHFEMFQKLAEKYGMSLVYKENFAKLFEQRTKDKRNVDLLKRMNALEEFPPDKSKCLVSSNKESYSVAQAKLNEYRMENPNKEHKFLTISSEEWEAITLYLAFAFVKTDVSCEEPGVDHQKSEDPRPTKRKPTDEHEGDRDCSSAKNPKTSEPN